MRTELWRLIPHVVTGGRAAAGFVILFLVAARQAHALAFVVFVAAILTDLLDGWLARRLRTPPGIGVWLDPLCDKILVNTTWIGLWLAGWAPSWLALTVLARDGLVAGGWLLANRLGKEFRPNQLGKLALSFEGVALPVLLFRVPWMGVHWPSVGLVLGGTGLVLSLASAGVYGVRGPDSD